MYATNVTDADSYFIHRPLLLTSSIIPKDEKSETICDAIVQTINDKASHLDQWAVVHEKMFGDTHSIPSSSQIHMSKLEGGLVNTDTCNGARIIS